MLPSALGASRIEVLRLAPSLGIVRLGDLPPFLVADFSLWVILAARSGPQSPSPSFSSPTDPPPSCLYHEQASMGAVCCRAQVRPIPVLLLAVGSSRISV